LNVCVTNLDPNVALNTSPCEDGLAALRENFGNVHLNAVWLVTLAVESHVVRPILTKEGDDKAPKLDPKTVMVPPSSDRGEENDMLWGES
jgi:hypothetical protein